MSIEDDGVIFRAGYPFGIVDNLLYNVAVDGSRTLYVLYAIIKTVLELAYDEKYYFGRDRILYDLRGLLIYNKTRLVKTYIRYYGSYNAYSISY